MDREQLDQLAHLNELRLTQDESDRMLRIFQEAAPREASLLETDTEGLDVMVHVLPLQNVFREDSRNQAFPRAALLRGAPEHTEDSWQVPRLVK